MNHLDEETFAALLAAPHAYPQLREHLRQGCAVCEQFLATTHHPLLDAATDDALLALAPAPAREVRREARIYEQVDRATDPGPRRRRRVSITALAVLVAVATWLMFA